MSTVIEFKGRKAVVKTTAAGDFKPHNGEIMKMVIAELKGSVLRYLIEFLVISVFFLAIFFGLPLIGGFFSR